MTAAELLMTCDRIKQALPAQHHEALDRVETLALRHVFSLPATAVVDALYEHGNHTHRERAEQMKARRLERVQLPPQGWEE